ncbi:hypothetical protein [Litoreibacter arenae]|uniref:Transmembrane protein n=1 Tax=Litoreibacter arenae DSM 19593 TaxID=1123360 RepID=S9QN30_9RHOB|nr:hypothetical protein [Litoreibacter arenae]EPX81018.1 hypothetical protein thalar_00464 [Litoreibacter arenae DSM 19593]
MTRTIHPIAGGVALLMIVTFWLSTAVAEVFADIDTVVTVKTLIPWGFVILIPALATVGGSGFKLGKKYRGPLVETKKKRMPFIAANGILILIPSALFLSFKAQAGAFDQWFYIVQGLELIAGAVNISLLGLNMRDGLRLKGKLRKAVAPANRP